MPVTIKPTWYIRSLTECRKVSRSPRRTLRLTPSFPNLPMLLFLMLMHQMAPCPSWSSRCRPCRLPCYRCSSKCSNSVKLLDQGPGTGTIAITITVVVVLPQAHVQVSPLAHSQLYPTCTAGLMVVVLILVMTATTVPQDTRQKELHRPTGWQVATGDASDMEGAGKANIKNIIG